MPIQFPILKPSSLTFTPATYNVTTPQFLDIVTSPRLLASKPNSPTLSLDFRAISADKILSIFTAWESSYSGLYELVLPPEIVSSIKSVDFAGRIVSAQSTGWRFSGEPTLSNVTAGVGDVSVQLKGELYDPNKAILRISSGTRPPLLGSSSATTFTDWNRIVNSSQDDANILFGSWPFSFFLANTTYTACYIGSNGYATFGSGSSGYSNLSASTPAFPKVMFGSRDSSWQRVYTQTSSSYVRFRWEGSQSTSGTPGASNRIVEVTFWKSDGVSQLIEIRTGDFINPSASEPFMVASASTAYASATTLGANQSWVFEGIANGTGWNLKANKFVSF
jgi:hypothetical protein